MEIVTAGALTMEINPAVFELSSVFDDIDNDGHIIGESPSKFDDECFFEGLSCPPLDQEFLFATLNTFYDHVYDRYFDNIRKSQEQDGEGECVINGSCYDLLETLSLNEPVKDILSDHEEMVDEISLPLKKRRRLRGKGKLMKVVTDVTGGSLKTNKTSESASNIPPKQRKRLYGKGKVMKIVTEKIGESSLRPKKPACTESGKKKVEMLTSRIHKDGGFFRSKLESTSKRLGEAYKVEDRKRRPIKVLDVKDLPKQSIPQEKRRYSKLFS